MSKVWVFLLITSPLWLWIVTRIITMAVLRSIQETKNESERSRKSSKGESGSGPH